MEPETPLPWISLKDSTWKDTPYILRACNAYPKLVEFVQYALRASDIKVSALRLLKELGE